MRNLFDRRALAGAALAAALASGCAAPPTAAVPDEVRVERVERLRWDLPPEGGLFRVSFGPAFSRQLRAEARGTPDSDSVDYYYAEIAVLEREAERALRGRGFCPGVAKLASEVQDSAAGGYVAVFRCRLSILE